MSIKNVYKTEVLPLDFSSGADLCSGPPAVHLPRPSPPLTLSGMAIAPVLLSSFILSILVLTVTMNLSENLRWLPMDSLLNRSRTL